MTSIVQPPENRQGRATMSSAMPSAVRYHKYVYSRIRPHLGRRVWEIGCASGYYTRLILEDGRSVLATDSDVEMLRETQQSCAAFAECCLDTRQIDLTVEADLAACAAWQPDTVVCLNVLEHINDDRASLAFLSKHAAVETRAVFLVPAFPALYGFMDAEAGHYRRYTASALTALFVETGWCIERACYINALGGLGWFVRNRLRPSPGRSLDDPEVNRDIRIFDRYCIPPTRCLDLLCSRFFGQSLIVVARKPVPERNKVL